MKDKTSTQITKDKTSMEMIKVEEAVHENGDNYAAAEMMEAGNIGKIRDILFGVQMRDNDRRFNRLEERLLKESGEMKDETRRRVDSLEEFFRKEMESLSNRLVSEQNARTDAVRELVQTLKEFSLNFDTKTAQLNDQNLKGESEIRQQLLDQSKQLRDEIQERYTALLAALDRESDELRHDKTDRSALAEMFTEVAMRLNNDFKMPNGE